MISNQVGHYHIEEELGPGGMGVVYKAHDTKLDRTVALKFLPHELTTSAEDHARFLQEARAASALNHPNICAIHALGQHEGLEFIDMEYIEGKTLRKLVPVSKLDDAISFAIQIAEALQEAHAKGIVQIEHRTSGVWEENPGNIRVNIRTTGALKSATLVGGIFMDGDESNNTWTSK
jgi:serine/threonine protein kinase